VQSGGENIDIYRHIAHHYLSAFNLNRPVLDRERSKYLVFGRRVPILNIFNCRVSMNDGLGWVR